MRRARGSASSSGSGIPAVIPPSVPMPDGYRGYKPFLERLKPPTFSGKVEDWPEFRAVWQELLADMPESVQIQHIKTNLPANDSKRIAGIKTMREVWQRLERVYGDKELNIVTVKSNLEGLVPKATQEHKRVQEVFEAVEIALTQLRNLGAESYVKDDFSLMHKIVMKLPISEQTKYTDYITSAAVELDPSPRWDKFWAWLRQ